MYQLPLNEELIIDNFAGGGGASCGIEMALGRPVNIAINHDIEAIKMHETNHPHTKHYCEDVWDVVPKRVCNGRRVAMAWFSPDCKHFSKAKGGKPVSKKIRGLAWVVLKWASLKEEEGKPRVIFLENVEEFTTWGPLVDDKPCPKRKGETFNSFVRALKRQGYNVEWRLLKASDYGVPTIRKRLFMIARCDGLPIVWPEPTHGEAGTGLKPVRTAAECIDWSIPCPSIFERKKPLAENTMKRIAKGLKRFVFDNKKPFLVNLTHGVRLEDLEEPFKTITAAKRGEKAVVVPYLTEHANASKGRVFDAQEPLRTQCAEVKGGHFALVAPFISRQFGQSTGSSAKEPIGTVTSGGGGKSALMQAFLMRHFGTSDCCDIEEPAKTVVSKQKDSLASVFLAKHYGGVTGVGIDTPLPTITSRGTQNQVVSSHIMKMRGQNVGHECDKPLHTISAGGLHHAEVRAFLIKYYGSGDGKNPHTLEKPLGSVTSKERFGIVTVQGEEYVIVDIGMRMLAPRELYRAQGFPDSYVIDKTSDGKPINKTTQVRMCGNSVPPLMAKMLVEANVKQSIFTERKKQNGKKLKY